MAERLKNPIVLCVCLLVAGFGLTSCVSTEELYAEYDAHNCKIVVEKDASGITGIRELVSDNYLPWEPAVYFGFDQSEIDEQAQKQLQATIEILAQYPHLKLSLHGFTDHLGPAAYNNWLATLRIRAVTDYLASAGIARSRLIAQPLGEGLPRFGVNDKTARSVNRRVELMLLDETGRPVPPFFNGNEL